jgi:hypothetical protein
MVLHLTRGCHVPSALSGRRPCDEPRLGDRTEIEFFNDPHTINGVGTFAFLERMLRPRGTGR